MNNSYTSTAYTVSYTFAGSSASASVQPYVDTRASSAYVNPTTFQIICPGLDGQYGGTGGTNQYPNGPYGQYQSDDITNFTKGSTLADDTP